MEFVLDRTLLWFRIQSTYRRRAKIEPWRWLAFCGLREMTIGLFGNDSLICRRIASTSP